MGTVSGPAGYLCSQYFFDPTDLFFWSGTIFFLIPHSISSADANDICFYSAVLLLLPSCAWNEPWKGCPWTITAHAITSSDARKASKCATCILSGELFAKNRNSDANTFIVYVGEGNPWIQGIVVSPCWVLGLRVDFVRSSLACCGKMLLVATASLLSLCFVLHGCKFHGWKRGSVSFSSQLASEDLR